MNTKLTTKKYFFQKVAKIISVLSLLLSVSSCGYIFFLTPEQDELKLTFGVVAFFFSAMAVVLFTISSANLPDLSVKTDDVK